MTDLVLLHGFTGDATSWDEVRSLLDPSRRIFCATLLGHGEDARDPSVDTFEAEVDRLARAIEGRGSARVHLCGYSLGARVGLGLLVRHPRLFARATLIGVHPGLERAEERAERERSDRAWIELLEQQGERFAGAWEAQALFASQSEEQRRRERARRSKKDPLELARSLRVLGLARMPSFWRALPALQMEVHVIAGAEDRKFSAIAERMHALLPHGELTIVPGCGHNVPLESPATIARALERTR